MPLNYKVQKVKGWVFIACHCGMLTRYMITWVTEDLWWHYNHQENYYCHQEESEQLTLTEGLSWNLNCDILWMHQTKLFGLSVFPFFMQLRLVICLNYLYSVPCVMWELHAQHKHTHHKCIFLMLTINYLPTFGKSAVCSLVYKSDCWTHMRGWT